MVITDNPKSNHDCPYNYSYNLHDILNYHIALSKKTNIIFSYHITIFRRFTEINTQTLDAGMGWTGSYSSS